MSRRIVSLSLICFLQLGSVVGEPPVPQSFLENYCYECHDSDSQKGDLDLEILENGSIADHGRVWEKVVRKMDARQMPPIGNDRPDEELFDTVVSQLAESLDQWAELHPNPGRTETIRRLTRTEYQNAIRDLLAIRIDAGTLLPRDEASHGFDNVTVGTLSPTLLNRYITAAQKISRLAVGASTVKPGGQTYRIPADVTQESHVEGLPLGTRGGLLIPHTFSHDAEYEIRVRLARDRNEEIEGLTGSYDLDVLIDNKRIQRFTVAPPKIKKDYDSVDGNLSIRMPVKAGLHQVGVTFEDRSDALLERQRQPYKVAFNMHRHPRLSPAIYQVSINGPFQIQGSGDTESRSNIFIAKPLSSAEEEECAERILSNLMRRAFRRPITSEDLVQPLEFYQDHLAIGGFEAGIENALAAILVSPEFLFRIESEPDDLPPDTPYEISDLELASRLSFFLWSSIPDEPLLDLASRGELSQGDQLARQTMRMLKDPRATTLVTNFADQWLYLRNLDSLTPDARLFPDFDENLRKAFRKETEMFFGNVLKKDRSVLEFLQCDYTFLNERLAKHYGIPGIHGSHFRKVALNSDMHRGGVLRHGSILSVTSYATRTSPVIRGHWILGNLLGSPPPPPPPDVPALEETSVDPSLTIRERFAEHRANAACARCHDVLDPVGFVLENFDAVGRWRDMENGRPVDASGGFSDGSEFEGVRALEEAILNRPELFVQTITEKLMTYALGRGMETYDAPAIRRIIRQAEKDDFRMSSIIQGIVHSQPFTMRKTLP
ncbi:MAG: DUF1592 domain-containing protein [Verrucomicrobia bacterium]|nr:DUF1592 domain-containing protein [Verrucomicrobiota bacterium]